MSIEANGPVLVEGPVELVCDDGTIARSDRFMVAVCTCRRSRTYPWCDTSHRARVKHSDTNSVTPDGQNANETTTAGLNDADDRNRA
ncbi:CDGSH iron-sulfur domain-containing protein [Streptomyces sp. NPDC059944]|uniref:CDGSH iron-sulfur domain-containing protein n=1 Tax=Streptomyces sp. NPDC059944 TaxID=3347011 RepID=UPI003662A20A